MSNRWLGSADVPRGDDYDARFQALAQAGEDVHGEAHFVASIGVSSVLVPRITVPCHILFAADDPLIDAHVFDSVALPANVQVLCTRPGGHLGFSGPARAAWWLPR